MSIGPEHFAVLSALVFTVGLAGVLTRGNPVAILMCAAVMVCGPVIALVGFTHLGQSGRSPAVGDALSFVALLAVALEAATGAAVALLLWRRTGSAETDDLRNNAAKRIHTARKMTASGQARPNRTPI